MAIKAEKILMSSLLRYKKSGGFNQLLSLIETFGTDKKKKFIEMVESESSVWADALREKMLSVERILNWPDQVMIEVFKNMQPKNLVYALEGISPEQKARILTFFSSAEKRRMSDILTESAPKPEEIAATLVKVVEQARKMLQERTLHADKFDAALVIPEDYESKLESQQQASGGITAAAMAQVMANASRAPNPADAGASETTAAGADVIQLQKTLGIIAKENKWLKDEVRALREKLDQIKKLTA